MEHGICTKCETIYVNCNYCKNDGTQLQQINYVLFCKTCKRKYTFHEYKFCPFDGEALKEEL